MGEPVLYPLRQGTATNAFRSYVECMTNNTSAPDGIVDPNQLLDPDTPPAYSATGKIAFTLAKRYSKVIAHPVIECATDHAFVESIVDGYAAPNVVNVVTAAVGGAAEATNDKVLTLALELYP